ncbi:hypothetical protein O1F49_002213 [Enterococcus hirae]|nr:hypothetical protein [Enterococcus hirae]EMF0535607.1 hypothetical protein [Enterococcus hirae]
MLMTLDNHFVEEMRRCGYDVSFMEIQDIYRKSRIRNYEVLKVKKEERERQYARKYYHETGKQRREEREAKRKEKSYESDHSSL